MARDNEPAITHVHPSKERQRLSLLWCMLGVEMMALLNASDWDRTKAGMLLQRAGFGGTPDEVDALAKLSPAEAAESLLGTSKFLAFDPPSFLGEMNIHDLTREERAKMGSLSEEGKQKAKREFAQYARATQSRQLTELRGWWLKQMADPARAAREKLTLFRERECFVDREGKGYGPFRNW